MFSWFKPTCPVDPAAKLWIESRLNWLSDQFGQDVFTRRAVILPTEDFFPDRIDGSKKSIRNLLNHVCRYMDVDPTDVGFNLFTNQPHLDIVNDKGKAMTIGAAGLYEEKWGQTIIHIETSEVYNLASLVGTMAHELAHQKLMGENRVTGNEFDNELLTDLTAVFHGFGIFLGNDPRAWEGDLSTWPGTKLKRPEYMSLPMFAYAIAHTAWLRGEQKPEWQSYLSFALRPCFRQGVRYLFQTEDTLVERGLRRKT